MCSELIKERRRTGIANEVGINAEINVDGRSLNAVKDDGGPPDKHDVKLYGDCARNVADYL